MSLKKEVGPFPVALFMVTALRKLSQSTGVKNNFLEQLQADSLTTLLPPYYFHRFYALIKLEDVIAADMNSHAYHY